MSDADTTDALVLGFKASEASRESVQPLLDDHMAGRIAPMAAALTGVYLALAVVHWWIVPALAPVLSPVALATGIGALAVWYGAGSIPAARSHAVGAGLAGAALLCSLLHLQLASEALQSTNVILLLVAAASLFVDWRWTAAVIAFADVGWLLVALGADGDPAWVHFGFAMVFATVFAAVLFRARHRSLVALLNARADAEARERFLQTTIEHARRQESRWRRLIEALPDGVLVVDRGRVATANPAAQRLLGPLTGLPLAQCAATTAGAASIDALIGSAARVGTGEVMLRTATGGTFDGELSVARLADGQQVIVRDVTARRRTERLKDEMLAMVSHELATPLTAIEGPIHLLEAGMLGPLSPPAADAIELASRNVARLHRVITALIDAQRATAGALAIEPRPVRLDALVRAVLARLEPRAAAGSVTLVPPPGDASAWVMADADRVGELITCLVENAITASPAGADVRTIVVRRSAQWTLIVQDRGPGLSGDAERLFTRFNQGDSSDSRPSGGLGLGLFLARTIARAHGGDIVVDSRPGDTSFSLSLPVHDPAGATS